MKKIRRMIFIGVFCSLLFALFAIPAAAVQVSSVAQLPDSNQYYLILYNYDGMKETNCLTSTTPFLLYAENGTWDIITTASNCINCFATTDGNTWNKETSFSGKSGSYLATSTFINSSHSIDLYNNDTSKSLKASSFFSKAPLAFNLPRVVKGANLQPLLEGIAAVLGGCLILLILIMSFRNGWQFLLRVFRHA